MYMGGRIEFAGKIAVNGFISAGIVPEAIQDQL
jgi:hypothetical protein